MGSKRCGFQTLVGSFPHYHILLWLKSNDFSTLEKLVISTKRHLMFHLESLFLSNIKIIKNADDRMYIINNFVTIQTHSCEKSGFRCFKKSNDNEKICRFPPYKPSNETWLKSIPQKFTIEAEEFLKKIGFIKETEFETV